MESLRWWDIVLALRGRETVLRLKVIELKERVDEVLTAMGVRLRSGASGASDMGQSSSCRQEITRSDWLLK